jgi:hypothetical protein
MDQPDVDRFVPRRLPMYFATLDSPMWRAIHGAAAAASVARLERREQPIGIKAHTKTVNELSVTQCSASEAPSQCQGKAWVSQGKAWVSQAVVDERSLLPIVQLAIASIPPEADECPIRANAQKLQRRERRAPRHHRVVIEK